MNGARKTESPRRTVTQVFKYIYIERRCSGPRTNPEWYSKHGGICSHTFRRMIVIQYKVIFYDNTPPLCLLSTYERTCASCQRYAVSIALYSYLFPDTA